MSLDSSRSPERFTLPSNEKYSNDDLKSLLREVWLEEVKEKTIELGQPLTEEEQPAVTEDFIDRWHKKGRLPSLNTFERHFSSIIHLANLVGLPAAEQRVRILYEEGSRSEYIRTIREWVRDFEAKEGRKPKQTEVSTAIGSASVPGVPARLLRHIAPENLYEQLGIERVRAGGAERKYDDQQLLSILRDIYEQECLRVAIATDKASLTDQEKASIKLTLKTYNTYRKLNSNLPMVDTIIKRFGTWSSAVEKAKKIVEKKEADRELV